MKWEFGGSWVCGWSSVGKVSQEVGKINLYTLVDRMSLIEDKSIKGKDSFKLFKSLKSSSSLKWGIFGQTAPLQKMSSISYLLNKEMRMHSEREHGTQSVNQYTLKNSIKLKW